MNGEQMEARMVNRARRIVSEIDQLIVDTDSFNANNAFGATIDIGREALLTWRRQAVELIAQIQEIRSGRGNDGH